MHIRTLSRNKKTLRYNSAGPDLGGVFGFPKTPPAWVLTRFGQPLGSPHLPLRHLSQGGPWERPGKLENLKTVQVPQNSEPRLISSPQALLCESGCNFWYHRICTGLAETAFQLLTQEVYAEWVCDNCVSTKDIAVVKFK